MSSYTTDKHEHDRFLYLKDGFMHFGCINPFCMHGNPGLPHYWRLPMDTTDWSLSISHKDRKLHIVVTLKVSGKTFKAGEEITIIADDNLESCSKEFKKRFTV
ncbi:MAG: hypothetical protein FD156_1196 [Nitrospirae bacterium]|nr:MAG: hypothetical protein FD156_1196 [Nitrospirota bacterium]